MSATFTFANATTSFGSVASQAKFESIAGIHGKLRVKGTFFTNIPGYGVRYFMTMPGRLSQKFGIYHNPESTGTFDFWAGNSNDGIGQIAQLSAIASISPSAYYVLHFGYSSGAGGNYGKVYNADESVLLASGSIAGASLYNGGAGNGAIRVGNDGTTAHSWEIDGLALYSAPPPTTVPTGVAANILGLYKFDEGSGTSVADSVAGGAAMALNGALGWNAATGAWDAAAPAGPTASEEAYYRRMCLDWEE